LADWAAEQAVDLTVVGPDDPLADGIVDALQARGLRALGPTRAAAEIESSKSWAKAFMREHGIPTAAYQSFDNPDEADRYVEAAPAGLAVKADGLATGKGVILCPTRAEAHAAIDRLMRARAFGAAGARIVIEELLRGREVSAFALCDGTTYRLLPFACDHKAVFDGDRGPNTGGMGAYSPASWLTAEQEREIELCAIAPAVRGLAQAGRSFVGFLFAGLIVTERGLRVIEFNARLGDPEAQAILPRLDADLLELADLASRGRLAKAPARLPVSDQASCCVVMASAGYPGSYQTGRPISGLDGADALVFHAGTAREGDGWLTAGGRVLGVTALGADLAEARRAAYRAVERIGFEGAHYRRDVGR
jgi:phosphoribosylamine--glycine ligase